MSARIAVLSGVARGTEIWLEGEVLRVGSHPDCDICIPDPRLAPHAATLEYRAGQYHLHNRSGGPVGVGGKPLASPGSAQWPAGGEVQLTADLVMRLVVEGDPAPSPKPAVMPKSAAGSAPSPAPGAVHSSAAEGVPGAPGAPAPAAGGQTMQMAAIGGCVVLLLLALMFGGGGDEAGGGGPAYDEITQELAKGGNDRGERAEMLARIRSAHVAESRSETGSAGDDLRVVRDILLNKRLKKADLSLSDSDQKVWDYVARRLAALEE